MRRPTVLLAAAAVASLAATAVLAATSEGGAPASVMLHAARRDDGGFRFAPERVEVGPNGTLVLGHLFGEHSLTSVEAGFNATGNASSWPTVRAPAMPGTYRFHCWIHATPDTAPGDGMAGVLVVVGGDAAPPRNDASTVGVALAGLALLTAAVAARARR